MENLYIEETEVTPKILFDYTNHKIEFIGKSYPENAINYYRTIIKLLQEYFSTKQQVQIIVDLEYLNSSSLKSYFDIFDIFEEAFSKNSSEITIQWLYDEENDIALEIGEDFIFDFKKLNIELVVKENK